MTRSSVTIIVSPTIATITTGTDTTTALVLESIPTMLLDAVDLVESADKVDELDTGAHTEGVGVGIEDSLDIDLDAKEKSTIS